MSKSVSQSVSDIIRYRAAALQLKTRAQNIELWPKGRHFCDVHNFQKKIQFELEDLRDLLIALKSAKCFFNGFVIINHA